jgi:Zn-dependent oligopeptidase
MWSKVFALDAFYVVREQGLVNPEAGKAFVDKILAKGGSVDPNVLLRDYLGREPNDKAFFIDLGISV